MTDRLFRKLRERLTDADIEALEQLGLVTESEPEATWDESSVRRRAVLLEEQVERIRGRISERGESLAQAPRGRQLVVLENSPPPLLVGLAFDLIARSSDCRYDSPARSLEFAQLGLEVAKVVERRGLLADAPAHDLLTEAWVMLGNARRLVGELVASENAFKRAEEHLSRGTGDRQVRADYLRFLAYLRAAEGKLEETIELQDRQIHLRHLLGDRSGLGVALVDRGISGARCEPLDKAARMMAEGLRLSDDRRLMLLAAYVMAEQQARAGLGLEAHRSLCTAEAASLLAEDRSFERAHQWISGITHRVLGHLDLAEKELTAVRDEFAEEGNAFRAAVVSLDLTAVYAAKGLHREALEVLRGAHQVFVAHRIERHALGALTAMMQAARAEELTEALAVDAGNFFVRSRYERKLEFDARR